MLRPARPCPFTLAIRRLGSLKSYGVDEADTCAGAQCRRASRFSSAEAFCVQNEMLRPPFPRCHSGLASLSWLGVEWANGNGLSMTYFQRPNLPLTDSKDA